MATYNERENLPDLVRKVLEVVPYAELLVVDDNSPDGTGQWVAEQAASDARIRCLHRPRKLGLGSATVDALKHAVHHAYVRRGPVGCRRQPRSARDPPDARTDPASSRRSQPDIVIGSRYVPGGGTVGWPCYRRWMSRSINAFARLMLGLPVRDCSGAFRCIRVAHARARGSGIDSQSRLRVPGGNPVAVQTGGARFEEIPIVFANRQRGTSKINTRESLAALWMLFRLGLRNWFRI